MSVLFVGNGINRYARIVPGWDELFAKAINIDGFQVQQSLTPTLEYELNVRNALDQDKTKTADDIKKGIAAYLTRMQNEASIGWEQKIHVPLLNCAPHTILTTNYDYFLERAANSDFKAGSSSTKEWLYSKERYRDVPNHRIHHIHGEISVPTSICLGYEHYIGSIQYIRAELTRRTSEKGTSPDGGTSKPKKTFHIHDVLAGLDVPVNNRWYYYFFTDDIYILGFGLDPSEQDIWWLLNYRAELMRKFPGLITNTITYLETDSEYDAAPINRTFEEVLNICISTASEKKKRDALDSFGRYNIRKKLLAQKRAQLEAFNVYVNDCTALADFEKSYIDNKINWDRVYTLRYERALNVLKGM